ncbi:MAG TPA: hypothetical protein VIO58_06810 [Candidatus Methanoperedens sp.]
MKPEENMGIPFFAKDAAALAEIASSNQKDGTPKSFILSINPLIIRNRRKLWYVLLFR